MRIHDERFPAELRLKRPDDFQRVYRDGQTVADEVLVMRACDNQLQQARLGLSVSRRVGNAVLRNRWKRLVREAFRLAQGDLPAGYDYVVRPRRGAEPESHAIRTSLLRLARRVVRRLEKNQR